MAEYATPPTTPQKVPGQRAAGEEEEEGPRDASMRSVQDAFPPSPRYPGVLFTLRGEDADEEHTRSTSTVGNQADEAAAASASSPGPMFQFELDEVLSIDMADVEGLEEEEEEEEGPRSLTAEAEARYGSEQGLFAVGSSVFVGKRSPTAPSSLPGIRGRDGGLLILTLNHRRIDRVGDTAGLARLGRDVQELDLAFNELRDWEEVLQLLGGLPRLRHANLSHNDLSRPFDFPADEAFPRLRSLVLNATHVRWDTLFRLLRTMPYLSELHLSLNDYSSVGGLAEAGGGRFPSVHKLHLSNSRLGSWAALRAIVEHFPCLEELVALENEVGSFGEAAWAPDDAKAEIRRLFPALVSLNLNGWRLESWEDVERIAALPLLWNLRLAQVPLLASFHGDGRQHVIARCPALTAYNGSDVTADERETAERSFLRYFAPLPSPARPPRHRDLEVVHGQLQPLADIRLSPRSQVEVRVQCRDRRLLKIVSLNQTVGQLKKGLAGLMDCGARFHLFFHSQATVSYLGREELKLDRRALHSLGLEDGDLLELVPKPPEPQPISSRRRTSSSLSSSSSLPNSLPRSQPTLRPRPQP